MVQTNAALPHSKKSLSLSQLIVRMPSRIIISCDKVCSRIDAMLTAKVLQMALVTTRKAESCGRLSVPHKRRQEGEREDRNCIKAPETKPGSCLVVKGVSLLSLASWWQRLEFPSHVNRPTTETSPRFSRLQCPRTRHLNFGDSSWHLNWWLTDWIMSAS